MKPMKLIVGPSGSGKNFLAETFQLQAIPSYTTRPQRPGEIDGFEHIFATLDEWKDFYTKQNNVVAWTFYSGNYYWATVEQYEDDAYDAYIIDPDGVYYVLENYANGSLTRPFVIIFLKVSVWKRFLNMKKRGDSLTDILKRLRNDRYIFSDFEKDMEIFNGDIANVITVKM